MNCKSRITISVMLVFFTLSMLSIIKHGENEINILTIQVTIFSAASVAAAIARCLFNRGAFTARNYQDQLSLPSMRQFIIFLAAFFILCILILYAAIMMSILHLTLELRILLFIYGLMSVPVVIAAGLLMFWLLEDFEREKASS